MSGWPVAAAVKQEAAQGETPEAGPHAQGALQRIALADWCSQWGLSPADLSPRALARFASIRTDHRPLDAAQAEAHAVAVLNRLVEPGVLRSTEENARAFEAGWEENLRLVMTQGVSPETLRPRYVKPHACMRWQGRFVAAEDPFLYDQLLRCAVDWAAERHFGSVSAIHEFGCGTGRFLHELAGRFPGLPMFGLDWTRSSQQLLARIAADGVPVRGARFDMLAPDPAHRIPHGDGVLTVGAMEQLGDRFGPFLGYLLDQAPAVCVHLEPIEDFYGRETLADALARVWHRKRGYLSGFLATLRTLEGQGRVRILQARRLGFGCAHHESGSLVVWQPLPAARAD